MISVQKRGVSGLLECVEYTSIILQLIYEAKDLSSMVGSSKLIRNHPTHAHRGVAQTQRPLF